MYERSKNKRICKYEKYTIVESPNLNYIWNKKGLENDTWSLFDKSWTRPLRQASVISSMAEAQRPIAWCQGHRTFSTSSLTLPRNKLECWDEYFSG
jgi:hypothetical protein